MPDSVKVVPPGTPVGFGEGQKGHVLLAAVGVGGYLSYQIGYWDKGERKTQWLEPFEIKPDGRAKQVSIGFSSG